jgi:hypothetical protein
MSFFDRDKEFSKRFSKILLFEAIKCAIYLRNCVEHLMAERWQQQFKCKIND